MFVGEFEAPEYVEFDPYKQMISALPYMVEKARDAAQNDSISYRGFHVGASVFAVNESSRSTGIFNGGNLKITRARDKVCAEKRSIRQAEKKGFMYIPGLVVVATTDIEQIKEVNVSNIGTPTLPPCGDCQDPNGDVAGSPLVDRDTLVLTTGINNDLFQVHSLGEIQDAFTHGDGNEIQTCRKRFSWYMSAVSFGLKRSQNEKLPVADRRTQSFIAKIALLDQTL